MLHPHLTNNEWMVPAEIIFGTPSEGCKGHGICMLLPEGTLAQTSCHRFKALFVKVSYPLPALRLHIPTTQLSQEVLESQFSRSCFLMQEELELPGFLSKGLGLQERCLIPSGSLPLNRSKNLISIDLPIIQP